VNEQEAKELAEAHWEWVESLLHKIYVDAMIHGIKHGQQQTLNKYGAICGNLSSQVNSQRNKNEPL